MRLPAMTDHATWPKKGEKVLNYLHYVGSPVLCERDDSLDCMKMMRTWAAWGVPFHQKVEWRQRYFVVTDISGDGEEVPRKGRGIILGEARVREVFEHET